VPQSIRPLLSVTVPSPVVAFVTVKLYTELKVAVTEVAAFIVMVHVPVPEHPPPDQPEKIDPLVAEAVRITDVP